PAATSFSPPQERRKPRFLARRTAAIPRRGTAAIPRRGTAAPPAPRPEGRSRRCSAEAGRIPALAPSASAALGSRALRVGWRWHGLTWWRAVWLPPDNGNRG